MNLKGSISLNTYVRADLIGLTPEEIINAVDAGEGADLIGLASEKVLTNEEREFLRSLQQTGNYHLRYTLGGEYLVVSANPKTAEKEELPYRFRKEDTNQTMTGDAWGAVLQRRKGPRRRQEVIADRDSLEREGMKTGVGGVTGIPPDPSSGFNTSVSDFDTYRGQRNPSRSPAFRKLKFEEDDDEEPKVKLGAGAPEPPPQPDIEGMIQPYGPVEMGGKFYPCPKCSKDTLGAEESWYGIHPPTSCPHCGWKMGLVDKVQQIFGAGKAYQMIVNVNEGAPKDIDEPFIVYEFGEYPRSSVNYGMERKTFLDSFRTLDEARSAFPEAEVSVGFPPSLPPSPVGEFYDEGSRDSLKTRRTWKMNPVTRVKDSDKAYDRNKAKEEERREVEEGIDDAQDSKVVNGKRVTTVDASEWELEIGETVEPSDRTVMGNNIKLILEKAQQLQPGETVLIPVGGDYYETYPDGFYYGAGFEVFAQDMNTITAYGEVSGKGMVQQDAEGEESVFLEDMLVTKFERVESDDVLNVESSVKNASLIKRGDTFACPSCSGELIRSSEDYPDTGTSVDMFEASCLGCGKFYVVSQELQDGSFSFEEIPVTDDKTMSEIFGKPIVDTDVLE